MFPTGYILSIETNFYVYILLRRNKKEDMKKKYGLFQRGKKNDRKELTKAMYKSRCLLTELNKIK